MEIEEVDGKVYENKKGLGRYYFFAEGKKVGIFELSVSPFSNFPHLLELEPESLQDMASEWKPINPISLSLEEAHALALCESLGPRKLYEHIERSNKGLLREIGRIRFNTRITRVKDGKS